MWALEMKCHELDFNKVLQEISSFVPQFVSHPLNRNELSHEWANNCAGLELRE